jgi:hypothetical protein
MKIFKEIKSNIYDREYYKEIPNKPFRKSLKYLFKLCLLAGLGSLIVIGVMSKEMPNIIRTEVASVVNQYPEDLVVTFKDGLASTNKEEPVMIPIDESNKKIFEEKEGEEYSNLVVIDTKNEFSLEKLKEYKTFALLTKENIIFSQGESGEIRIFPISDIDNLEVTKAWLLENTSKVLKKMPIIIAIITPIVYIMFVISHFVFTLLVNLFFALFIWVMSKVKNAGLDYKKSYQLGIHSSTIYVILSVLGMFLYPFNDSTIRIFAVILIIWINFFMKKETANPENVTLENK